MRCANRGDSRAEFLLEASNAMLRFTGADRLDIWLEDGGLCYHWQGEALPSPAFRNTNLSASSTCEALIPANLNFPKQNLMERVLPLIEGHGQYPDETDCSNCNSIWLGESIVMPFEIDEQNEGVLKLTNPNLGSSIPNRIESYEDLAQLLGVAISNRRAKAALLERVKELTCMYRIAHIAAESDISLEDMLQEIVELLPVALQYPNIATARISLGQDSYISDGFEAGPHRLSADMFAGKEKRGEVEVFYTKTAPNNLDDRLCPMEEPFLAEEQHLIDGVARELNSIVERKYVEQEKQQLQEQVRHADRLVTIGELAAGVAHELNEPLGNILGFAQLAMKSPNLAEQARNDIEKIERASLYAREIIRKLMFFSRQSTSRMIDLSLNNVVEDSLLLLEPRCESARIEVIRDMDSSLPLIHGDPSQLQQVLVNLVVNAIQSMAEGGTLKISTLQETDKQCMIVEDSGAGITPDNLKRVFLPFFTTKDVGQGTGLGLSVVHGIITSHGGSVRVDSVIDNGTRFEVRLPNQAETALKSETDEE